MFVDYLKESIRTLTTLCDTLAPDAVEKAVELCVEALKAGNPLLVCGNGGSAADAMHITAELAGRFLKERRGLNVICLASNPAFLTAWANDYTYETIFSRQVEAYGQCGGVLLGLSTSGNSSNVVAAFNQAKTMGMTTIALTGQGGGKLKPLASLTLEVPSNSTPHIQEGHVCLYHYICAAIEAKLA